MGNKRHGSGDSGYKARELLLGLRMTRPPVSWCKLSSVAMNCARDPVYGVSWREPFPCGCAGHEAGARSRLAFFLAGRGWSVARMTSSFCRAPPSMASTWTFGLLWGETKERVTLCRAQERGSYCTPTSTGKREKCVQTPWVQRPWQRPQPRASLLLPRSQQTEELQERNHSYHHRPC